VTIPGASEGSVEPVDASWDADSIAQVREAAKRLRDTAMWTLAAIAAIGTTLGGAITFVGLKDLDLDSWRFLVGAGGLVFVVLAAAVAVVCVARVLAPVDGSLADIKDGEFAKGMLFGHCDLDTFSAARSKAEGDLVAAANPDAIAKLHRTAALYRDRAERIALIDLFVKLEGRWRCARRALAAAVFLVALGVTAYMAAASDQRASDNSQKISLPDMQDTSDLIVDFATGALGTGVPKQCAGPRRAVEIPHEADGPVQLVLRPKGACPGLLVRVKREQVTIKPARVPKAGR
jgi:hypothetical protein